MQSQRWISRFASVFPMARFVCLADFEKAARKCFEESRANYFTDGCDEQFTLNENRKAFQRYRLRPKLLRDVSKVDMSTKILGNCIALPIGISPTAFHRMVDDEGEKATARAAHAKGTVMILSCVSTYTIEDVAAAAPYGLHWMQVQIFKNKTITDNIVKRAEAAGFRAIVLTIDLPLLGKKYSGLRNRIKLHPKEMPVNFDLGIEDVMSEDVHAEFDNSATWEDVRWVKSLTRLPLVLKGITTADQARNAVVYGADAILVSNHGGRQLDYLPATIDVLPEVVAAVKGSGVEVYMDGGVRHGTDVFKALARGAKAVFIGKPTIWGLACNGCEGVKEVLEILKSEFETTMRLMGCTNIHEIAASSVVHKNYFKQSKL